MKKLSNKTITSYLFFAVFIFSLLTIPASTVFAASFGNNSSAINVTLDPNPSFDVTVSATRQESAGVTDNVDTNYINGKWVIGPIESVGGSCSAGPTDADNVAATRRNTFLVEVKDKKSGKTVSDPAISNINFCGQSAPAFLDVSITTVLVSQASGKGKARGTLLYLKDDGKTIPFRKDAVAKLTCDKLEPVNIKIDDSGKFGPTEVSVKSPGGSTCVLEASWKPKSTEDGTITQFVKVSKTVRPDQTVDFSTTAVKSTELPPEDDPANTEEAEEDKCAGALNPFGWILCPILNLTDNVYQFFVDIVRNTLFFEPEKYNNTGLKDVSRIFTTLANVLIVLFALMMIASQIFSFEVFSAYTIKKVLPKLILGAIFIQLSWPIFTLMIQLVNAIGTGLYWLFMAPFASYMNGQDYVEIGAILGASSNGSNPVGTSALGLVGGAGLIVAGAAIATVTSTWLTLILAAIGILISLITAILTLIVREVILILLLAIAPLGLVMWIFPGTNKFWNMWWQNFSKLLIMYPLIMLLIASGSVAAIILSQASAPEGGININKIFAIVAYFAPIFMIGWTFKFAGQAFGSVGTIGKKWGDKARNGGMFGWRDKAKMRRDTSAWSNIQANRKENLNKKLQEKSAQRITGTGKYEKGFRGLYSKRFVQNASTQGDIDNLIRAQARAGEQIQSEEAKAYKNRGSLVDFQVQSVAKRLKAEDARLQNVDLFEIEKNVRAGMLAGGETFGSDIQDAHGNQITFTGLPQIDDSLKEDVALAGLKNKDNTGQLITYYQSPDGFQALKDRGTMDAEAWKILVDKLPTAAKGATGASLGSVNVRGFNDARKNFAGLAPQQQTEIIDALVTHSAVDADSVATVLADLTRNTPGVDQDHLNMIQQAFDAAGLGTFDLGQLRKDPNATITNTNGQYQIT